MTKIAASLAAFVAIGLLTGACGNRPVDRALTSGAAGATIGAVTAPEL